jgi:hypothetical protein
MVFFNALTLLNSVNSQEKYAQIGVHKMDFVQEEFATVCQVFMALIVQ